jgi:hypothetical protein
MSFISTDKKITTLAIVSDEKQFTVVPSEIGRLYDWTKLPITIVWYNEENHSWGRGNTSFTYYVTYEIIENSKQTAYQTIDFSNSASVLKKSKTYTLNRKKSQNSDKLLVKIVFYEPIVLFSINCPGLKVNLPENISKFKYPIYIKEENNTITLESDCQPGDLNESYTIKLTSKKLFYHWTLRFRILNEKGNLIDDWPFSEYVYFFNRYFWGISDYDSIISYEPKGGCDVNASYGADTVQKKDIGIYEMDVYNFIYSYYGKSHYGDSYKAYFELITKPNQPYKKIKFGFYNHYVSDYTTYNHTEVKYKYEQYDHSINICADDDDHLFKTTNCEENSNYCGVVTLDFIMVQ